MPRRLDAHDIAEFRARRLNTLHHLVPLGVRRLPLPLPRLRRIDHELLRLARRIEELADIGQSAVFLKTQIVLRGDDADGVGVAHAAAPALDTDDGVAFGEDAEFDGRADAPLEAGVDVFLPIGAAEVGFGLGEAEGVHAAVEMGVARRDGVAGDHDDGADGAVFRDEAGGVAAGGRFSIFGMRMGGFPTWWSRPRLHLRSTPCLNQLLRLQWTQRCPLGVDRCFSARQRHWRREWRLLQGDRSRASW